MQIDSYSIKISAGKVAIGGKLDLDDDVKIIIDGSIVKREDYTNNDGTIERCYTVRGTIGEIITTDGKTHKEDITTSRITY